MLVVKSTSTSTQRNTQRLHASTCAPSERSTQELLRWSTANPQTHPEDGSHCTTPVGTIRHHQLPCQCRHHARPHTPPHESWQQQRTGIPGEAATWQWYPHTQRLSAPAERHNRSGKEDHGFLAAANASTGFERVRAPVSPPAVLERVAVNCDAPLGHRPRHLTHAAHQRPDNIACATGPEQPHTVRTSRD